MSKTDKTRPFWVRLIEDPSHWIEEHDHREGACDLPERPDRDYWQRDRRCNYNYRYSWAISGEASCGCPICTSQEWRRRERRVERYQGKKACRDWWKEW